MSHSSLILPERAEDVLSILAARCSVEIERKRADEALRESEQRFKEIAYLLPEAIYEMGIDCSSYSTMHTFSAIF